MSSSTLSHRHPPVASTPGSAYYPSPSPPPSGQFSLPEPLPSTSSSRGSHGPRSWSPPSTSSAGAGWDPARTPFNTSLSTLENARYSLETGSKPDHQNEDRYFAMETRTFKAFAVLDGHDGERAVGFASSYLRELFYNTSWERAVASGGEIVPKALEEFFKATDREFFKSIRSVIDEVQALKTAIPSGLKSYEAYQRYPYEVNRLQTLEPKLAGGCTAAVAVIANNFLFVANVGDSRVLLIKERPDGTLAAEQLTQDDSVENDRELVRLEALGLRREALLRAGRLGTQENTRSIGDYNIKEGYKDVDSLSSATGPPGICNPHIIGRPIDGSFQYLVLMSDGVYKSIESTFADKNLIDGNKVLTNMILRAISQQGIPVDAMADYLLFRLMQIHEDCYSKNARKDPRSPLATSCRKRDDMTLIFYKFPPLTPTTTSTSRR